MVIPAMGERNMSEAATENPPATGETEEATPEQPKDWQAEAEKWKRLSRENEGRAKSNAEAARRLAELEESQKSEAQKVADKAAAAEQRAAAAERRALRAEIAAESGIPADLLSGETEDEIRAYADRLKAFRGNGAAQTSAPPVPRPDPSQGNRGDSPIGREAGLAEARRRFPEKFQTNP